MNTQLIPVPYLNDTLYLIDNDGEPFVPVKPISEALGLAWQPQHRKINDNKSRWGIVIMVIPTAGGAQEMLSMPLRKVPAYLYSIEPRKVKPESREKVERYQAECDDVLWKYWSEGHVGQAHTFQPDGYVPLSDYLILEDAYYAAVDEAEDLKEEVLAVYRHHSGVKLPKKRDIATEKQAKLPVEVIELMEKHGVPRNEIAKVSGRTLGCLRVHVHNARKAGRLQ